MDVDGYPEDEELERVRCWPFDHPNGWRGCFDYIKGIWWAPEWGWKEIEAKDTLDKPATHLYVSTGGWSGNESVISAMQGNPMLWMSCWVQSRRGGHYVFELKDATPEKGNL